MLVRILATALVTMLCATASAWGSGWGRPVAVANMTREVPYPGFLTSPNEGHTVLVTLSDGTGIDIYPWLARQHRFGSGARVPRSTNAQYLSRSPTPSAEYPDAAISDTGALAIAWLATQGEGLGIDECFCAVRAVVQRPNGHFAPVQEIAPASSPDKEVIGLKLTPSGPANVLWSQSQSLKLTTTPFAGRAGRRQSIAPKGAPPPPGPTGDVLEEEHRRPVVIYPDFTSGATPLYETRPPFSSAAPLGAAPSVGWIESGTTLVGDGRGDELALSTEWDAGVLERLSRQGGHGLGAVLPVVPLNAPAEYPTCELDATMNARGMALVAWACGSSATVSGGPTSFVQAALLSSDGSILALSPQKRGGVLGADPPGVALDDRGRGLVTIQAATESNPWGGVIAATLERRHFGRWQTVIRSGMELATRVSAAITAAGTGLATWSELTPTHPDRVMLAETQLGN